MFISNYIQYWSKLILIYKVHKTLFGYILHMQSNFQSSRVTILTALKYKFFRWEKISGGLIEIKLDNSWLRKNVVHIIFLLSPLRFSIHPSIHPSIHRDIASLLPHKPPYNTHVTLTVFQQPGTGRPISLRGRGNI